MADPRADVGTGTTITFQSGFFAEVTNIGGPALTRANIDTSHMLTVGGKTFKPTDLYDLGDLSIDVAFDPAETPPIDQPAETVTITWPDGSTWQFTAFMTGFEPTAPLEEKMTASATLKCSGDLSVTAASA